MMPSQPRPLIALSLSVVIPGLGQWYIGQRAKAVVLLGAWVLLGVGAVWLSGVNRLAIALALALVWSSAVVDAYKSAKTAGRAVDWYYRTPYVVAMLLLVGPLALPLLWRSPYFSRTARWLWTTLVIGVLLLFLATPYLLQWLIQQLPELQTLLEQAGVAP